MEKIVKGVYPVMITPFTADNQVDWEAVDQIVEFYAKLGCDGIFAVCQSSEMFFLTDEELPSVMPEFIPGNRGFVYCYSEGSVFYTARIAIETGSTSQAERSHIIREELVNGLGLLNDHLLYSDSVIYQNYNNNMPTEMDWLMLNMVYSPLLWPGVARAQAEEILLAEILR